MNLESRNHPAPDDLDWLAFCYINDELTEQELQAFEIRLAEDQSVRDAVERAVRHQSLLAAALKGSPAETARDVSVAAAGDSWVASAELKRPHGSTRTRIRLIAWTAAAAAVVLLALGLWIQRERLLPGGGVTELAQQNDQELPEWVGEEWLEDEDFADQLADAMVHAGHATDENPIDDAMEQAPVFLGDDWMLDVFVELDGEWDAIDEDNDSGSEPTDSKQSWG